MYTLFCYIGERKLLLLEAIYQHTVGDTFENMGKESCCGGTFEDMRVTNIIGRNTVFAVYFVKYPDRVKFTLMCTKSRPFRLSIFFELPKNDKDIKYFSC